MSEAGWLHAGNSRDLRLNLPVELFTRQITTAAFPIGIETFGVSNLLTWSACLWGRGNRSDRAFEKHEPLVNWRSAGSRVVTRARYGYTERSAVYRLPGIAQNGSAV